MSSIPYGTPEPPSTDLDAEEVTRALKIARELVEAGVPVFAAPPDSSRPGWYLLPKMWQHTSPTLTDGSPNYSSIERWRPGWALGAVGGWAADFLDEDPRSGGNNSMAELRVHGQMPRYFGVQVTPSGGRHYVLSPTGERKETGFMPGLDLQSGAAKADEHGTHGRGFVYIAPTVRPSKAPETLGQLHPYRWLEPPDIEGLAEFAGADDSLEWIISRVHAAREGRAAGRARESALSAGSADPWATAGSSIFSGGHGGVRRFTMAQAQDFLRAPLVALAEARIGEIEERCNVAAVALSHFVPSHFTPEQAMALLRQQLAHTAYDPNHPASGWTAEKFVPVLAGHRPIAGDWKAEFVLEAAPGGAADPQAVEQAVEAAPVDEVEALLGEMLTLSQVRERPPKEALIQGLLMLDSESWIIGAPGSKKSFVVLDMACHVALGRAWQGRRVTQKNVVIIAAEGAGGLGNRVRAWETRYGELPANVWVLPRPVQASNTAAWAVLIKACQRLAPGLVVVDTQARVTVGLDENAAKDAGIYIAAASALRLATGACALTVHHTGRNGGDARGSSAIDGAQDTELKIVSDGADRLRARLRVEKQKDLEQAVEMDLHFERVDLGLDANGDPQSSLVLLDPDVWRDAQQRDGDVAGTEDWEINWPKTQGQIITVLIEQGGEVGLTKSEARTNVAARWYGGRVTRRKDKEPEALASSTYDTAWTKALEARTPAGDPVVVNSRGERYVVDMSALAGWREAHPSEAARG